MDANDRLLSLAYRLMSGEFRSVDQVRDRNPLNFSLQPTVKFYSKDARRRVTVLEDEEAELPLRLTGDGVSPLTECIDRFLIPLSRGESSIAALRARM